MTLHNIRRDLIAKRVRAGATSPIGRRLSTLIGLIEIEPADERHASRRLAGMARVTAEIETLIAARGPSVCGGTSRDGS